MSPAGLLHSERKLVCSEMIVQDPLAVLSTRHPLGCVRTHSERPGDARRRQGRVNCRSGVCTLSEHQVTVGRLLALYAVAGQILGQELDRDRASDGGL